VTDRRGRPPLSGCRDRRRIRSRCRHGTDRLGLVDVASILCRLQLGELVDGNQSGHRLAIAGEVGDLTILGLGERIGERTDRLTSRQLVPVHESHRQSVRASTDSRPVTEMAR
jgi:hypothetical protein